MGGAGGGPGRRWPLLPGPAPARPRLGSACPANRPPWGLARNPPCPPARSPSGALRPAPPRAALPPLAARSLRPLRGSGPLLQEAAQALPTEGGAACVPAPPPGPAGRASRRKEAGSAGGRGRGCLKGPRPLPGQRGQCRLRPPPSLWRSPGRISHPHSTILFTLELESGPRSVGPGTVTPGIKEESKELEALVPACQGSAVWGTRLSLFGVRSAPWPPMCPYLCVQVESHPF